MAFKRIKDWATSITAFRTGDVIPVDGPSGTAKMGKDDLLKETAQNALAGSVAPAFDPTKPNDAGGYAYYKDEVVVYNGTTYKFKVNHSSGAWNASHVDRYDLDDKLKIFVITDNSEYLYAITDKDGVLLFGIKKDGSVEWQVGIPSNVKRELENKVEKEIGRSLIDSVFADAQGSGADSYFLKTLLDKDGRVVEAVNIKGEREFFTRPFFKEGINWNEKTVSELVEALKASGFSGGAGDWSDEKSLEIATPRCAVVNFSNIDAMPTTKTQNYHGYMQFWDMCGNYFKKKVIMNAQGNSSLAFVKKNLAIDICNDDWVGDDTFKIRFGAWVSQDSFHLKAYYTDYFRGCGCFAYEVFERIAKSRGLNADAPWKIALADQQTAVAKGTMYGYYSDVGLQVDTGARNHPLGFPCLVFLNGNFYGIFAWQLKKHRDNYHMDKSEVKHVHLDGQIDKTTLLGGSVDWTAFEVRNPKSLISYDGTNYDGDNPTELIDSSSPNYNSSNAKHVKTAQVKSEIEALSSVCESLETACDTYGVDSSEVKSILEEHFDVDNLIDYIIFTDIIWDQDSYAKNWQWTTYDGVKWFLNPYDLDASFGNSPNGQYIHLAEEGYHARAFPTKNEPNYYIVNRSDFSEQLKQRYAYLRTNKIISPDVVIGIAEKYINAIGSDNYKKEWVKWPDCMANNDSVINQNWEIVLDENGQPVYGVSNDWDETRSYAVDEIAHYTVSYAAGVLTFRSKVNNNLGNRPIATARHRDSIYRLRRWIIDCFNKMDNLYNYLEA